MRAYVINLDKDGARRARVTRECVAAAIPCERFPAVEGRRLAPLPNHSTGRMMSQGATGCFLSHRALWQRIAALAEPTDEDHALPDVADATPADSQAGATRVSNTLLPADVERSAGTDRAADPQPVNEYGSELPPLDERGSELAPLNDSGAGISPSPQTDSTTQRDRVSDAVRNANGRTQFGDTTRRSDPVQTAEPPGLRRSWPDETSRYGRSRRVTNDDGPFPLLRRLFDGPPAQDRYTRRPAP